MDNVETAVSDLATALALPSLALNEEGVAALDVAEIGEIQLERWRGDGLLVSLFRDVGQESALRMFELCAPSGNHPAPILAGMDGRGRLGFVMRLDRRMASHDGIERCLGHMTGLFEKL